MADIDPKITSDPDAPAATGIPGSASQAHPSAAIPLPAHGFDGLADTPIQDLAAVPAGEVITRAAVLLISASAERLGLTPDGEPDLDLNEARRLITALAGLLAAAQDDVGVHQHALHEGLRSLQKAFRAASRYPDEPGQGPGENYLS